MYLLNSPGALTDQSYMIGNIAMTIISELFSIFPTSSNLTFTYTSSLGNGDPLPAFISGINTLNDYQYIIYSSKSIDVGTYFVKLTAEVKGPG
jgi:hypothetical protein